MKLQDEKLFRDQNSSRRRIQKKTSGNRIKYRSKIKTKMSATLEAMTHANKNTLVQRRDIQQFPMGKKKENKKDERTMKTSERHRRPSCHFPYISFKFYFVFSFSVGGLHAFLALFYTELATSQAFFICSFSFAPLSFWLLKKLNSSLLFDIIASLSNLSNIEI